MFLTLEVYDVITNMADSVCALSHTMLFHYES